MPHLVFTLAQGLGSIEASCEHRAREDNHAPVRSEANYNPELEVFPCDVSWRDGEYPEQIGIPSLGGWQAAKIVLLSGYAGQLGRSGSRHATIRQSRAGNLHEVHGCAIFQGRCRRDGKVS
ncbi:hypothetical protein EJ03DRAFT_132332 [Teratosphaeria nubilosa]|uniref:Uncharacterized protein n=1 Tax=Teratosphaeria nubilosa TaxID=161662 RepID=A0A6G1LLG7_9PEZI|nr:hypothetical protein EJ03DRAFT_132332 [Teratosphaeria nubilosa]